MPVTDSHHHVWDLSAHDQPFLDSHPALAPLRRNFALAELAPLAAGLDVTATVLVQTVTEPWETPELLALAAAEELVAGVVGWTDLTGPDVAGAIAELRDLPGGARLAGVRHPLLAEPDARWLTRPAVLRGLAAVAAAGLACDVVGEPRHLHAAAQAATALPDLQLVLDHLGNPDVGPQVPSLWQNAITELAARPNVVCKLSGFLGVPAPAAAAAPVPVPDAPPDVAHLRPYYRIALEAFGPDRLMFGSDWPVSTLQTEYSAVLAAARTLTADLSPAEQDAIFRGTAQRVYQLPGAR